jgi:hypothetical protein
MRRVWLSYEYLKDYGITVDAIKKWSVRHIGRRIHFSDRTYIDYDTIPEPTRKHLPNKECLRQDSKLYEREKRQQELFDELNKAYQSIEVGRWRNEIRAISDRLKNEDVEYFARRAVVFERVLEVYHGACGDLECLHKAYLRLIPDGYTMKNRFAMAIKQAKEKGILSVAVNYNHLTCRKKPIRTNTNTTHCTSLATTKAIQSERLTRCFAMRATAQKSVRLGLPGSGSSEARTKTLLM